MANEIFTRIQLKYDSWANWNNVKDTFVPLKGEVCVVNPGEDSTSCLIKVGDGSKTFGALPWLSALAADVAAWAKADDVRLKDQKLEFFTGNNVIKTVDLTTFATEAEVNALLAGYKKVQTAVPDPTANGKSLTFIDTISQNTQGVITATKKNVNLDDYALKANLGDVSTLKTTAKTAVGAINEHDTEIGDLTKLSTSNKGDLVTAINEVRQAVEVGGTGSVVTVRKDGDNTYHVQQGGKDVDVAIELGNGGFTVSGEDGLEGSGSMTANQAGDTSATIKHAVPTGATAGAKGGEKQIVTAVTTDKFGHITAVTAESNATKVLIWDTFNDGSSAVLRFNGPGIETGEIIICGDPTSGLTFTDHQNTGIGEHLTAGGFTIDASGVLQNAKDYTDTEIAKAHASVVDYRGVANKLEDLFLEAGKGDFHRVGTEIKSENGDTILAYAGDLIVAEKDKPAQQIDGINWSAIHCGDGDISEVKAGNGLTGGGATGSVTISHGAKPTTGTAQATTKDGKTRTYVTGIDVDKFGHIAAVHTQEEQSDLQDLSGKADIVPNATAGNFAGLDADGNLTDSGYNADDFATAAQGAKADTAIQRIFNDGEGLDAPITFNYSKLADGEARLNFWINDGAIETEHITDKAVTAAKLADDVKELIKTEAATLDAVVLAESQKYTDEAIDDLHAIATSGSIYDVAEGANDNTGADKVAHPKYLIFNCGSSTTVI